MRPRVTDSKSSSLRGECTGAVSVKSSEAMRWLCAASSAKGRENQRARRSASKAAASRARSPTAAISH